MLPDLLDLILEEWREPLTRSGADITPPVCALKTGGNEGGGCKVNFLIFSHERKQPALVLKIVRSSAYCERLRGEFNAVAKVANLDAIRGTVPKPLGLFDLGAHLVMAEAWAQGTSLEALWQRRELTTPKETQLMLLAAQQWVGALQAGTQAHKYTFRGRHDVETRLIALAQNGHAAIRLPKMFINDLLRQADRWEGILLPLAGCHGDFWPGNFFWGGNAINVIDWEHFGTNAMPFTDLFSFLVTAAQSYPWGGWRRVSRSESFSRAFLKQSWFSEIVLDCTTRHFRAIQVPEQSAHFFFSLFLLDTAVPRIDSGCIESQTPWIETLVQYANRIDQSIFRQ